MRVQLITSSIHSRVDHPPVRTVNSQLIKHQRTVKKFRSRKRLVRAIASVCPRMFLICVFITELIFQPRGASAVMALGVILVFAILGVIIFIMEEIGEKKLGD